MAGLAVMYCTVFFVHQRAAAKRCSLQEHTADPTCYISHLYVVNSLDVLYLSEILWFVFARLQTECFAYIFIEFSMKTYTGFYF